MQSVTATDKTDNTHDLERQVKDALSTLPSIEQIAQMEAIQANYVFVAKDKPDWSDDQVKAHVYRRWLRKHGE